jgi:hypothetical protein
MCFALVGLSLTACSLDKRQDNAQTDTKDENERDVSEADTGADKQPPDVLNDLESRSHNGDSSPDVDSSSPSDIPADTRRADEEITDVPPERPSPDVVKNRDLLALWYDDTPAEKLLDLSPEKNPLFQKLSRLEKQDRHVDRVFLKARARASTEPFLRPPEINYDPLTDESEREKLRALIKRLHQRGTSVELLAGHPLWVASDQNTRTASETCRDVVNYNRTSPPKARVDGVHLEIEPRKVTDGPYAGGWWGGGSEDEYNSDWIRRWKRLLRNCGQKLDEYASKTGHSISLSCDLASTLSHYNGPMRRFINSDDSPLDYVTVENFYDHRQNRNGKSTFFHGAHDGTRVAGGVYENLHNFDNIPVLFGMSLAKSPKAREDQSFFQEGVFATFAVRDQLLVDLNQANILGTALDDYQTTPDVMERDFSLALWVWNEYPGVFSFLEHHGGKRQEFFDFLDEHRKESRPMKRIFLEAKETAEEGKFRRLQPVHYDPVTNPEHIPKLQLLVRDLHAIGAKVEYLDGQAIWLASQQNMEAAKQHCRDVISYNKQSKRVERLDGIHLDIEPHTVTAGPYDGVWWTNRLPNGYNRDWTRRFKEIVRSCAKTIETYEQKTNYPMTLSFDIPANYGYYNKPLTRFFNNPNGPHDYVTIMNFYDNRNNIDGQPSFFHGIWDTNAVTGGVENVLKNFDRAPVLFGLAAGPPRIVPDRSSFRQEGIGPLYDVITKLRTDYESDQILGAAIHHYAPDAYRAMRQEAEGDF